MKQPAHRTMTVHWDGSEFAVTITRNHIIQSIERFPDIELKIPDTYKTELKRTD